MAAGMAASGGVQAAGALIQGQSSANSLDAQADLNIENANEAEQQGAFDATKSTIQAGHKIGSEVANYGASGVTSTSGSVMAVLGASAANAELDRLNILHGADIKSIQYQNQASMERLGATSAIVGSYFSAAGAAGGAAAKAYGTGEGAD